MRDIIKTYDLLLGQDRLLTLEEKIQEATIHNYAPLLVQIAATDPIQRNILTKKLAKKLKVPVDAVREELKRASQRVAADSPIPGLKDPAPWPTPVEGAKLAREVYEIIVSHVRMTAQQAVAVTLWALLTWTFNCFDILPILAITSPDKRCGKTSLLGVLRGLVNRPLGVSNISPAALYRIVQKWNPVLLIDEGDTFLTESDELRGILNSGHVRHLAFVVRWNQEASREEVFSTWCPKAIATIGSLPPTLADRAIEIRLTRKRVEEQVKKLPLDPLSAWEQTRRRLARWRADFKPPVEVELPNVGDDRWRDNWTPLLAIAEALGGDWPTKAQEAMATLGADRDDTSVRVNLLADIKAIFEDLNADKISTQELLCRLMADETAPWATFNRGRPLTAHGLAKLLRPFGVRPQTIRRGTETMKGYVRRDLKEIWSRYLPPVRNVTSSQSSNSAENAEHGNVTQGGNVTDSICEKAASLSDCYGVTDQKEGGEGETLPEGQPFE